MDGSATLPNVTSVRFILVWVLILVRRARASGCIARIIVGRRATRALPPTTTRRRRFMVPDEAVSAPQATPFPSACDKTKLLLNRKPLSAVALNLADSQPASAAVGLSPAYSLFREL